MACNVYLSFFRQYDSAQLKGLEWKYLGACYGVPFIPAIVFLFVSSPSRGKVFGSAVLWCWISPEWNVLRIAVFYGPVWIVILTTIFIYIRVGMVVFRWRKQLLSLDQSGPKSASGGALRGFAMKDLPSPAPMSQAARYEVTITSQVAHSPDWKTTLTSPRNTTYTEETAMKSPTSAHARFSSLPDATYPAPNTNVVVQRSPVRVLDANKATLSYCKTALLFFFALLCTWYVSAVSRRLSHLRNFPLTCHVRVPSTINRVNTLVHPENTVFGLDLASSLVLPLQGFWNTLIYIVTSLPACKALWSEISAKFGSGAPRPNRSLPTSLTISTKFNNHRTLGSEDTRADITMRIDGRNRVIEHNYRNRDSIISNDDYIATQMRGPSPLP
ncbi:uncharacterized protein A1O9_08865 [Exophiala aquamarina CBS 119918]|uniref:G-protein coupled receptors family 2 profile 2 domain-containing protein n=1 Tax=Exophiala aquamarina CBS 119918 TaxID=1182545 RepID=A0A072P5U5_9EURO|nr:uncharacterized protein A1O9_08865 [Exophiala aquamarina CBS 119918]KEF55211.1 hypothetical protein A1O9_08865 [Exophiala aquamarina CBS 119918]